MRMTWYPGPLGQSSVRDGSIVLQHCGLKATAFRMGLGQAAAFRPQWRNQDQVVHLGVRYADDLVR
jgi:hypothetical protein